MNVHSRTHTHTYIRTHTKLQKIEIPELKKYDKAPKIHFTEILLFENVTFRDIWGYIQEVETQFQKMGKQNKQNGLTKEKHMYEF